MNLQQSEPIHNREELQALASYLRNYDTVHKPTQYPVLFNLNYWCQPLASFDYSEQVDNLFIQPDDNHLTCGFVACAIGHLPYAYPQTQLVLDWNQYRSTVSYKHPAGQIYLLYDAICIYFNLSQQQSARWLFDPESYTAQQRQDPVYVGQRIQIFLNENPEPLP